MTDDIDLVCLNTLLKRFICEESLSSQTGGGADDSEPYEFFPDTPLYNLPNNLSTAADYRKFIQSLPLHDPPSIFGFHRNADLM